MRLGFAFSRGKEICDKGENAHIALPTSEELGVLNGLGQMAGHDKTVGGVKTESVINLSGEWLDIFAGNSQRRSSFSSK
ncbi:hypothetical protein [Pseudodesulfovibrio sp.]|uniref:hypothetical protein n=1 Tax=unclassified Pseudodesulfovibrio TaxID=2661612 RepID=UPI003B0019E0